MKVVVVMRGWFILIALSLLSYAVEHELFWDDDYPDGFWTVAEGIDNRQAVDFTPGYQCHLAKVKIKVPSIPQGTSTWVTIYADNSGWPGAILGSIYCTGILPNSWNIFDVTSLGIIINAGQKFYPSVSLGDGAEVINRIFYEMSLPIHGRYYSINGGLTWLHSIDDDIFLRAIVDDDMTPPYVNDQVPSPGSTVPPPLATIVFHCRDADKGVNPDTISFTCKVNGSAISGTLNKNSSDLHNVICTFTPTNPIGGASNVECTVPAGLADGLGNATTANIVWTFTVTAAHVQQASLGSLRVGYRK